MSSFTIDKRSFMQLVAGAAAGAALGSADIAHAQTGGRYASIRRARVKPGSSDELARRVPAVVLPTLRSLPEFVSFHMIYAEDDMVTAITVYASEAAAREANAKVIPLVREAFGTLLLGPPEPSTGAIIASAVA